MIGSRMDTDRSVSRHTAAVRGGAERSIVRAILLASVCAACLAIQVNGQELPTGGTVAHGDVTIARPTQGAMTITQGTRTGVVNWTSFSIGSGGHVDIRQPDARASLLNRVTGAATSAIHGRLTANGQVHLVNPNGIFIGPNGSVDASGFVASTLDLADDDFVAGRLRYGGTGNSATVTNAGRITIGRDGYAALLGGRVRNSGVVTVPMGRIAFGSGERAVLDLSGDQFLQVAVPTGGKDGDGALIENSGLASAQGGLVEMRAATAREAVRQAVNLSGVAEARSVSVRNGAIVLGGGAGGTVSVTGRASTRSEPSALIVDISKRPPRAPEITVTGRRILLAGAEIDASGAGGGGLVRIGGDFGGAGALPRSGELIVDGASTIRADAMGEGDGGRVALWSDLSTNYGGFISARGGDAGGDGGFVEVSSQRTLRYAGLTDTRAPRGAWGTTLLDPIDFLIEPGEGGEDALEASLELGSFVLDTSETEGEDPGDITINADIDWDAATTLFLVADNDVAINGSITAPLGGLDIDAVGTITAPGSISVNAFFLDDGSWEQFGTTADFFAADFQINQFASTFARTAGGDGSAEDPFQIFDIFGLQGIGTYGPNFVLANDIDGSGTSGWTPFSSTGFEPIDGFGGTLDGAGFTVSGLFQDIDIEGPGPVGFFDVIDADASVTDLSLVGANFNGSEGGILANVNDGTVTSTRVSGTLTTEGGDTGGFVGENTGLIEDSIADVAVSASAFGTANIGGFVGQNEDGLINRSHALGDVTVTNDDPGASIAVGGFVGEEASLEITEDPDTTEGEDFPGIPVAAFTINDSYAQGNVTVTSEEGTEVLVFAGGFVGFMDGTINQSYSTGLVTVNGDPTADEGGFAGEIGDAAAGTGNFWDVATSGQATSAFGTPLGTADFQTTETFIAIAGAAGWDFEEVWAPGDTGFYPVNYATSPVILADPDDTSAQYGLTGAATTTGTVSGGPGEFVFGEDGDTLDTSALFAGLDIAAEEAGLQPFGLTTATLSSANGVSYRVVDLPGVIEITPAPLTITANDQAKTYGQTLVLDGTEFTISEGTLFFDDSVTSVDLVAEGAEANAPVDPGAGGYAVFVGQDGANGSGLENYAIAFEDGTVTINPAPLTITPNDQVKVFGTTFVFDGTEFTTSGFVVAGDGIGSIALVSDGAPATADVGAFPILIAGLTGTGLENYAITEAQGTMVVTAGDGDNIPRPEVTVTAGLPNPPDIIDSGDTGGFVPAAGEVGTQRAAETLSQVQGFADALQVAADSCGQSSGDVTRYLACLSDALDDFAGELDAIALDLPPGLENVARIIETARTEIDGAATRAAARLATATTEAEREAIRRDAASEARAALATASDEIRKAITLVRAEDPELANLQRATITTVAGAIDDVGITLTRVAEL